MDRREAINVLNNIMPTESNKGFAQALNEAIDLAIEALGHAESATTTDCNYTCSDCKHQDKAYEQEPCYSCFNNDGAGYEPDTDCISRADIEYHTQLEANGNGQYEEVEVAYKSDIDNLPPVTPTERTGEWIPVSERLPNEYGRYLVTFESVSSGWVDIFRYGNPAVPNLKVKGMCWYRVDDEWGDVVYDDERIFAWMPLPEPYKGGDTE